MFSCLYRWSVGQCRVTLRIRRMGRMTNKRDNKRARSEEVGILLGQTRPCLANLPSANTEITKQTRNLLASILDFDIPATHLTETRIQKYKTAWSYVAYFRERLKLILNQICRNHLWLWWTLCSPKITCPDIRYTIYNKIFNNYFYLSFKVSPFSRI